MQLRLHEGTTLHRGGRLFHQILVDAYCAVEQSRLDWIASHQKDIRVELYSGIQDAIGKDDGDASKIGQRLILQSSFTGGPRYMTQNYQDAMCICAWAGMPDLFITVTCNPKWKEIRDLLSFIPGQQSIDRPDVVSRVFNMKLKYFFSVLLKDRLFSNVIADVSTVEFQKRGLPHCHVLITLDKNSKLRDTKSIDQVICAELLDPFSEPSLHTLVCNHMIHGPCGVYAPSSSCMKNGKCSQGYPKKFVDQTYLNEKGFTIYRRRKDGITAQVRNCSIDNWWVIPYNKELLIKFACHVNIEKCTQSRLIKYLFMYVHKGHDSATVVVVVVDPTNKQNEIRRYLDSRYISACEAAWRLFDFRIHIRHPPVQRLAYHLPVEQMVYFSENANLKKVLSSFGSNQTMLLSWFKNNREDEYSRKFLYMEYPLHYVWDAHGLC